MKTKVVIDADNQKVIERFDAKNTKERVTHYQSLGKWNDVSVDQGGDIILWED